MSDTSATGDALVVGFGGTSMVVGTTVDEGGFGESLEGCGNANTDELAAAPGLAPQEASAGVTRQMASHLRDGNKTSHPLITMTPSQLRRLHVRMCALVQCESR